MVPGWDLLMKDIHYAFQPFVANLRNSVMDLQHLIGQLSKGCASATNLQCQRFHECFLSHILPVVDAQAKVCWPEAGLICPQVGDGR